MPLSGQTLTHGMQGGEVKLLHVYLQQLGYQLLAKEVNNILYGESTAAAVAAFQTQHGRQPTGEVDAATAKAINIAIAALEPKPDPEKPPNGFLVHGYVRQAEGNLITGIIVRAYDKDLPSLQRDTPLGELLGETTTGADGAYAIPYTAAQFSRAEKDSADLVVRAFNGQGEAIAESTVLFNAPPDARVDLITKSDQLAISEYDQFLNSIAPLIDNIPVAELTAEDLDFLTGETDLDRQRLGLLVIAHRHAVTASGLVDPAAFYGLMREGLPTELSDLLAQGSEVQRDALKRALADNIIPAHVAEKLDEILAQLKALRVRLTLQPPGQEQPSPLGVILSTALPSTEQQSTFLSLYTDHQGEIEDFWKELRARPEFASDGVVDQLQFSLQLGVLTGGNAPLVQLLHQDKKLTSTRDLVDFDVGAWQERITATVGEKAERVPPHIAGTTLEEKIANYAGSIVETLKSAFPTLYVARGLAEKPAVDAPLVKQVLALNDGLNEALNSRQPLPDNLNWGDIPADQQKKARASFGALQAELAMFPALGTKDALAGDSFTNPIREGVQKILQSDPDFDFGAVNIDAYIDKQKDTVFADIDKTLHEPVTQQLKALQRVYQVVPRYEGIAALMQVGLDSARAMTAVDSPEFVEQFAPQFGSSFLAQVVYDRALQVSDYATAALGAASEAAGRAVPWVIGPSTVPETLRATYAGLFGRLDLCECQHCRSVYSPAAYLVDLLHFLDRKPDQWDHFLRAWWGPHEGAPYPFKSLSTWTDFLNRWRQMHPGVLQPDTQKTPLAVLSDRRPDLLHLKLTCENTNTLIPYIDLVNEVLETYVAHNAIPDQALGDTGATSSAELLASPQLVDTTAYAALKEHVFPLTLPFNRDLEIVRTYLEHLGTSRYVVMKTCQSTRPLPADVQTNLAVEYLKLSPEDVRVLTNAAGNWVGQYYGYRSGGGDSPLPAELANVAVFLDRTSIAYADLNAMVKTRFLNPGNLNDPDAVTIADPDNSCDPSRCRLCLKSGADLTSDHWDRLQRLIRLWRRLGWPIHDVDRALTTLGERLVAERRAAGEISSLFLKRLGQAVQIKDDLGLSLAETLSLWADIDTHGDDEETRQQGSLYARLFLSRTVRDLAASPDAFDLNPNGTEIKNGGSIDANSRAIQAALRLTADEQNAIDTYLALNDELTLSNLSQLHRYVVLSRALRMPVRDLWALRELSGVDPFPVFAGATENAPTTQEQTARFIALARKLQCSGFSMTLLNYLYRHREDPASSIGLRQEELVTHLEALRAGLRKISEDFDAPNTEEERLRKLLAAVIKDVAALEAILKLPSGVVTFTVPLAERPPVAFPSELSTKITYDERSKQLHFAGAMDERERATLLTLAGATEVYQKAITKLFDLPRTRIIQPLALFLRPVDTIAELINNPAATWISRYKYLVPRALNYLSRSLVIQMLTEALDLDAPLAETLLTVALSSRTEPMQPLLIDFMALRDRTAASDDTNRPEPLPDQARDALVLFHRAATLVTTFRLTADEVAYLAVHPTDFAGFTLDALRTEDTAHSAFAGWEPLYDLMTFRAGLPRGTDLVSILRVAADPTVTLEAVKVALLAATSWDAHSLDAALSAGAFGLTDANFRDFFRNAGRLLDLAACMVLSRRLGVSPTVAFGWATHDPDAGQAQEVQSAAKAKYDEQVWLAVARSLNDPLRERSRDALVAYVLTRPAVVQADIRTADELFEYFLIDVEMDACMATSRVKQAISSVQLFIQRCLMNLEPGVAPSIMRADRWEWMRNYRVWEANRKVFLYPENWIEPELRDDKSPFFKDLENELLQNDVTKETAETAFLGYLEKLDEVARLDIRGMYWEYESELTWDNQSWTAPTADGADGQTEDERLPNPAHRADILHVFGRTQGTPPIYYYRRLINHTTWTPWEKVQADIEGDHLIPVVFHRRLHLFWPIFREITDPNQAPPPRDTQGRQPQKRLEIKLAWSEYKSGNWSAKKMTKAKLDTDYATLDWPSNFFFKATTPDRSLILACIRCDRRWTFTPRVPDQPSRTEVVSLGTEPPPQFREAILQLLEARVRQRYDVPAQWRTMNHLLDILNGFRDLVARPDLSFNDWASWLERSLQSYIGTFWTLFTLESGEEYITVGSFTFTGCDRQASAQNINQPITDPLQLPQTPDVAVIEGQMFRVDASAFIVKGPERISQQVLGNTDTEPIPSPSYMLYPHQYYPYLLEAPFFYQNRERTYFVTPEQVSDVVQQVRSADRVFIPTAVIMLATPQDRQILADIPQSSNSRFFPFQLPVTSALIDTRASTGSVQWSGGSIAVRAPIGSVDIDHRQDRQDPPWTNTLACPGDQRAKYQQQPAPEDTTNLKLRFHTFFHPHVCAFIRDLKCMGIPGLLTLEDQQKTSDPIGDTVFRNRYYPQHFVDRSYPHEDVDFEGGAYALYNWELFFHIPLLIAMRLSQNQRFDEARTWFHYIFDPTSDSTDEPPQRFWKTLPFYLNDPSRDHIDELLHVLSYRGDDGELTRSRDRVEAQIRVWRDDPFNPHRIARMRITAYQKTVVMKYIDNLIACGDQLFRQDTIESINQATQLYVLAHLMLGRRPEFIPPKDQPRPQTYAQLRPNLDDFSNALVATENALAHGRCAPLTPRYRVGTPSGVTLGATLYFCIPHNEKLLGYWNLVEDRLFKIRHCLNIEGVARQLPLFEPPIDPALLVRARAAGLDLSSILNDIHAGPPHYRFMVILQKALELCAEVRSLGTAFLAALEKKDAEELALLRSTHEINLLKQVRLVRQKQVEETQKAIVGLEKSKAVVEMRRDFYRDIARISPHEQAYMDNLNTAHVFQMIAQGIQVGIAAGYSVPQFDVGIAGWAASPIAKASFGGHNLGNALRAGAELMTMIGSQYSHEATMASIKGGYDRRWDEWKLQERLANKELDQMDKQLEAAHIRQAIAQQELNNHDLQIEQTKTVDEFMRSRKFTRKELYDWMSTQLSALYFQSYQLAYDMAKRAERAYQFERGLTESNFVRFGQWDSLRRGLLAGEQLTLDLKRLEGAYLDQNRREYEITKHVSLVLHDPLALIALKTIGQCVVRLPEALFDADYPGHYMRRLKSVSLTIPAVVGPYRSVNCTLTLLSNRTRVKNLPAQPYAEQIDGPDPDNRFVVNFAAVQSIATSHAQNDGGMFELNFRDERYLPFEGAGAISEWRIEMPKDCNAFDFNSITDVVLRISYTARDGGEALRTEARRAMSLTTEPRPEPSAEPLALRRLFSLKHEFATEWFRFLQSSGQQEMHFELSPERLPYQLRRSTNLKVKQFTVFLVPKEGATAFPNAVSLKKPDGGPPSGEAMIQLIPLESDSPFRGLGSVTLGEVNAPLGAMRDGRQSYTWSLIFTGGSRISSEQVEDILVVCEFTIARD